jgi:hypothetical protein
MSNSLRNTLADLAQTFSESVLAAIRSASIQEIVGEVGSAARAPAPSAPRGPGRPRVVRSNGPSRPAVAAPAASPAARVAAKGPKKPLARRTPAQVAKTLSDIVALLKSAKSGMRSEEIREALSLDKREMPRVLHLGLSDKKLRSKGEKRATTYTVA